VSIWNTPNQALIGPKTPIIGPDENGRNPPFFDRRSRGLLPHLFEHLICRSGDQALKLVSVRAREHLEHPPAALGETTQLMVCIYHQGRVTTSSPPMTTLSPAAGEVGAGHGKAAQAHGSPVILGTQSRHSPYPIRQACYPDSGIC
jgi:hypothetical protein